MGESFAGRNGHFRILVVVDMQFLTCCCWYCTVAKRVAAKPSPPWHSAVSEAQAREISLVPRKIAVQGSCASTLFVSLLLFRLYFPSALGHCTVCRSLAHSFAPRALCAQPAAIPSKLL